MGSCAGSLPAVWTSTVNELWAGGISMPEPKLNEKRWSIDLEKKIQSELIEIP